MVFMTACACTRWGIPNCFLKAVWKWLWLEKHEMNYQFVNYSATELPEHLN